MPRDEMDALQLWTTCLGRGFSCMFLTIALLTLASCGTDPGDDVNVARLDLRTDAGGVDAAPPGDVIADRAELDALLAAIEARAGFDLPNAWRAATDDEFREAARLAARVVPVTPSRDFGTAAMAATERQIAAISALEADGVMPLEVQWDNYRGTPSRIEGVGFVFRGLSVEETWNAFRAEYAPALSDLFDIGASDELRVVQVDHADENDRLYVRRYFRGAFVDPQALEVFVSNATSVLGEGVITRIVARWDRDMDAKVDPRAWVSSAEALASAERGRITVSTHDPAPPQLSLDCGPSRCRAVWRVNLAIDETVIVDAANAEVLWRGSDSARNGPIKIGTYIPGSGVLFSAVNYRGVHIQDSGGTYIGSTSQSDGTYTATGSQPWSVAHVGAMPTGGVWPAGRVDRRGAGDVLWWSTVAWNSVSDPQRTFNSPDAWPPNANFQHMSEAIYAWATYLQYSMGYIGAPRPDTYSYQLYTGGEANNGVIGGLTWSNLDPAPGSLQTNRALTQFNVGAFDQLRALPSTIDDFAVVAHEYGHAISGCAQAPGASCTTDTPLDKGTTFQGLRPPPPVWRGQIYSSSGEALACMYSTILASFRSWQSGGCPRHNPNFVYAGYTSTTDSYGGTTEGASPTGTLPSQGDCSPAPGEGTAVSCNMGFTCVKEGWHVWGFNNGECLKTCTPGPSACANPAQRCQSRHAATGGFVNVCDGDGYSNNWWAEVGGALAFDVGWDDAILTFAFASPGNNNNDTRDFRVGADTWFAALADYSASSAYEVSRAVNQHSSESASLRDDYTGSVPRATAIGLVTSSPTQLWWGNGSGSYPRFESISDFDVFLFRGVAGSAYEISASPRPGSPVDLQIEVYRWQSGLPIIATGNAPAGASAVVSTGALPATDWYAVMLKNRLANSGDYTASILLLSGDDLSGVEPYPMAHESSGNVGSNLKGYITGGDADLFEFYVPSAAAGASATITTTSSPSVVITAYPPAGGTVGPASGTLVIPTLTAGFWRYKIESGGGSSRVYTTSLSLSCAGSLCDQSIDVATRYGWGDRFAGRFTNTTQDHRYTIALNAGDQVSFSLSHVSTTCVLELDTTGPQEEYWYDSVRVFRVRDGAMTADEAGTRAGVGAHVEAQIAGTYEVHVRNTASSGECRYRLHVARSNFPTSPMPAW